MLENFQRLLNNMVQTTITMGLLLIGLWVIHFIDAVLMKGGLKQRFGIRQAVIVQQFIQSRVDACNRLGGKRHHWLILFDKRDDEFSRNVTRDFL